MIKVKKCETTGFEPGKSCPGFLYVTLHCWPCFTRSRQALTTRKRWSIVVVIREKSLTSDSPSSSDLPSEESDRQQVSLSHAESSCLFCAILRRCSTHCQNPAARWRRTRWTVGMHSWSELHRSKAFFHTLKKIKTYLPDALAKKKAFMWVSRSDVQGFKRSKARKNDSSG